MSKGSAVPKICRKISITEQTYYRWCKEYDNLSMNQARRLKEMEKENIRLKKGGD